MNREVLQPEVTYFQLMWRVMEITTVLLVLLHVAWYLSSHISVTFVS